MLLSYQAFGFSSNHAFIITPIKRESSDRELDHVIEAGCPPIPDDSRISDRDTVRLSRIREPSSIFKVSTYDATRVHRYLAIDTDSQDRVTELGPVGCTLIRRKCFDDSLDGRMDAHGERTCAARWHDALSRVSSVGGYFIPSDSLSSFVIVLHTLFVTTIYLT